MNPTTNRPFYIGSTTGAQDRFKQRWDALRDMGFNQDALDNIAIWVVQIKINDNPRPPNELGVSGNFGETQIDVEKLLIRTYVEKLDYGVRNVHKWITAFLNPYTEVLHWTLVEGDGVEIENFGEHDYFLAQGESL